MRSSSAGDRRTGWFALAMIVLGVVAAHACGPWLPPYLLDDHSLLDPPQFLFDYEMRDLASRMPGLLGPTAAVTVREAVIGNHDGIRDDEGTWARRTAEADLRDVDEALTSGYLKVKDPAAFRRQAAGAREWLEHLRSLGVSAASTAAAAATTAPRLPTDQEFGLYHQGALAEHTGNFAAATAAFEAVLALPPGQRRYRSIWAAYMLGRSEESQTPELWSRLRKLREDGFADSLALAGKAYGYEGKAALDKKDFDEACRLYLLYLGSGNFLGGSSLRMVVYAMEQAIQDKRLEVATIARWPWASKVWTCWLLCGYGDSKCIEWLAAAEQAPAHQDAARLAWLAYRAGDFAAAERWLGRGPRDLPLVVWLQGKLDVRAGRVGAAFRRMRGLPERLPPIEPQPEHDASFASVMVRNAVRGELAMLTLSQGQLVSACQQFLDSGYYSDAAYVADSVLTLPELETLVKERYPAERTPAALPEDFEFMRLPEQEPPDAAGIGYHLRYLLGRRLVRAAQLERARAYFPAERRELLARYIEQAGAARQPKLERKAHGEALWALAQTTRADGMELMGTEVGPDATLYAGAYPIHHVARRRAGEERAKDPYHPDGWMYTHPRRELPVSALERRRLDQTALPVDERYHYRYLAVALARRAARLAPDLRENIEQESRGWLLPQDERDTQQFYRDIERRALDSPLGRFLTGRD